MHLGLFPWIPLFGLTAPDPLSKPKPTSCVNGLEELASKEVDMAVIKPTDF